MTIDDDQIYWVDTDGSDKKIQRSYLDGTSIEELISDADQKRQLTGNQALSLQNGSAISVATTFQDLGVSRQTQITLSGEKHDGTAVNHSYDITENYGNYTVQHLLDELDSKFGVTASINTKGQLVVEDNTASESQLSVQLESDNYYLQLGSFDVSKEGYEGLDTPGQVVIANNQLYWTDKDGSDHQLRKADIDRVNEGTVLAELFSADSDTITVGGQVAMVDTSLCVGCLTCVRSCAFGATRIDAELPGVGGIPGAAVIEPALCQGCGLCAAACPAQAIQLRHYTDGQVMSKIDALATEGAHA